MNWRHPAPLTLARRSLPPTSHQSGRVQWSLPPTPHLSGSARRSLPPTSHQSGVQELREKEEHLPKDIRWHMIGHLQRNKVKYIAGYVAMIHSVDSARLAQEIEKEAARHDRVIPVLIEVNVAGEDTKFGVSPQDLPELCAFIRTLPHVQLSGLMTSAPLTDNPEEDRPVFRKMSQLSVDMNSENDNNKMNGILSMGMSGDFEIAVEEGSNCVRIGTTIFGARQYT